MKNVILVTALLITATASAAYGIEEGRQNALQRLADPQTSSGSVQARKINENDPTAIAKLIDDINAAARKNKERILSVIVINTDVAASTLEQEKARYRLTLGDVYVAHSLALATKKKFTAIVARHKSGAGWAQIAKSHNVSLKGSWELIKEMQKQ
ncbi:MAG TPA: hypothetical protein VF511_06780 [Chthoniobacterales bacterium]|jgi:hypothetical protein